MAVTLPWTAPAAHSGWAPNRGSYIAAHARRCPPASKRLRTPRKRGVIFDFLTLPLRYIGDENGWVKAIECQKMELGEPDASGRRKPIPIVGSETIYPVDAVVCAIGNSPNPLIGATTPGLKIGKKGNIEADETTGATSREKIWAGRRGHRCSNGHSGNGRRAFCAPSRSTSTSARCHRLRETAVRSELMPLTIRQKGFGGENGIEVG